MRVKVEPSTEIKIKGIAGFIKRRVTKFGNGAKVDYPKGNLSKTVYLVIVDDIHGVKYKR